MARLAEREQSPSSSNEYSPFVGFVVASIQALAGNDVCFVFDSSLHLFLSLNYYSHERAKRAIALCANSSIVCGSIIVGAWIGGPISAALGAGLTTPSRNPRRDTNRGDNQGPITSGNCEICMLFISSNTMQTV